MKTLEIPILDSIDQSSIIQDISAALDALKKTAIDQQPWKEYPYKPLVQFSIAHSGNYLFLKYYVSESTVKAAYGKPNDPVYKDSCVEFFIALDGEPGYYNFEFNAIGTCLLSFGDQRNNRKSMADETISAIRFSSSMGNDASTGNIIWELALAIPVGAFSEHNVESLQGKNCRGNFYKCGDDLPQPHYLSWNNITSPTPDFHLSATFGKIHFQ